MKPLHKIALLALTLIAANTVTSFAAPPSSRLPVTPPPGAKTLPQPPAAVKPAPKWKKGDQVEVLWSGTWYPAEILEVKAHRYRIHYASYGSEWDEDIVPERIRPRAGVTAAANSNPNGAVVRSGGIVPEPRLPKLPALPLRPGYVIGRAVFEDGRPVPEFTVRCEVTTGSFGLSPGAAELLGNMRGSGGHFAIKILDNATVTTVTAMAAFHYSGMNFYMQLCPLNPPPARQPHNTGKIGVERDFVLKITGQKPGCKLSDCRAYAINDELNSGYYGGTIALDCGAPRNFHEDADGRTSLSQTSPVNSTVTLTLVPSSPLLDGSPGQIIRRSVPIGVVMYLYGIPYGAYKASAQLIEPGGAIHNLRLSLHPLTEPGEWSPSVPVEWHPLDTNVAEVIVAAQLHLVE